MPPDAVRVLLYWTFWVASGRGEVVEIVSAAPAPVIVMVRDCVAVAAAASVTLTVNVWVALPAIGVPVIVPVVFSVRPVGGTPDDSDQA